MKTQVGKEYVGPTAIAGLLRAAPVHSFWQKVKLRRLTLSCFVTASIVVCAGASSLAGAQSNSSVRTRLLNVSDGQLVTTGERVHVRQTDEAGAVGVTTGVEFWFTPETATRQPILIGTDREPREATSGPHCHQAECFRSDEYSVALGEALAGEPEGWGALSVRAIGSHVDSAAVRVYWDATPPRAKFTSPRFNSPLTNGIATRVVAQSTDENIVSVKVKWQLASGSGRAIPLFEQHALGNGLTPDGHMACVPTTVAANMKWLEDTGQWVTVFPFCGNDNKCFVSVLGTAMGTNENGTSGAGAVDGTVSYLSTFGYQKGVHYTLEHPPAPLTSLQFGFSPENLLEQFLAGGAVSVGFHNIPLQPGQLFVDGAFGHYLALADVKLNPDGTALIQVMDPHVQPPSNMGVYRWFLLHQNGRIDWAAANPGYYSNFTGQVALDEMHILRDFALNAGVAQNGAQSMSVMAFEGGRTMRGAPDHGEVPGRLLPGRKTWVGVFQPPRGSPGPWLLTSESTDAAGHMQRDYQYVTRAGAGR
jgi:hypothetical protein